MKGAAILDGDTVIVREQSSAGDGEIVVATVAGETTVKRLELTSQGVRLLAENAAFAPIDVHDGDVTVHGVVIAVMRCLATLAPARPMKGRTRMTQRHPEGTCT